MKKLNLKSYIVGALTMAILFSSTLVFAETQQSITAIFGRVKLVVDGKSVNQETLLYNGTTYVPLRAAAEALGKEVSYDGETQTAYIGSTQQTQVVQTPSTAPSPTLTPTPTPTQTSTPELESSKSEKTEYGFDETFEFDGLSITFKENVKWHIIENRFSDLNGQAVFSIPVTIKNNTDDTHGLNMFQFTQYGANGTKLSGVASYFDNSVDYAGKMQPGATQYSNMYFLHDGSGDYVVEFDNYSEKVSVKLRIPK